MVIEPGIVALAQFGDTSALRERLEAGCNPNVLAFEFDFHPGSKLMFCNDWTPLSAAAAAGEVATTEILLEARADPNVTCCTCSSSGIFKYWTALDCAKTGDPIPFDRDPAKDQQPRHPAVEKLLLSAGAKSGSELPEPVDVNTYGNLASAGLRPNPCLTEEGLPMRPPHLYDEAEEAWRMAHPGAPKYGRSSGGRGCPMTSMFSGDQAPKRKDPRDRVYFGGSAIWPWWEPEWSAPMGHNIRQLGGRRVPQQHLRCVTQHVHVPQ